MLYILYTRRHCGIDDGPLVSLWHDTKLRHISAVVAVIPV